MTPFELATELRDILRNVRQISQQLETTTARLQAVQDKIEADDTPKTGE